MAVKSKTQTPKKKDASVAKKAALKKKDLNPDEDDMVDSEQEDEDMMELEDDESIAPDDVDSDDDEEMEDQPPKQAKQKKVAKGKTAAKEQKGKGVEPKEKKVKKSTKGKADAPATPIGKQTNGTKKSPDLALKSKESRSDRLQRTICVKHVKPTHTDEDIVQFFAKVGKCTLTKRVRSKALAMVVLDSVEQVEKAIDLNGRLLNGQSIVIERSKFVGMESALKEKKKLRAKKKKVERRKMAKQEQAGVNKKEPSTEANGKEHKKKGKPGKKKGITPKKSGKGKDVAKPTAIALKSKPAKATVAAKGTKKKEAKGKKVTK